MTTTILKIERIENPTKEFFQKQIYTARKPVIITGAINHWKAYSIWTEDYLNTLIGNTDVFVCASKNQFFLGNPEHGFKKLLEQMKFSDFIDLLRQNKNSTDVYYYLVRASIPQFFPELLGDIELPIYCEDKSLTNGLINLWLGCSGNISQLHYDLDDNFLVQVRGRKRVVLLDPWQTPYLYPFPANSNNLHSFSQIVNIDKPDLNKFPQCQKARYCEVFLEAGEMLFIPAFWWHQVYTIEAPQFPTISVNFWFKPPLMSWLTTPSGQRSTVRIPKILQNKSLNWRRKMTRKLKTTLKLNN